MEKFQQIDIVFLLPEVLLEKEVDSAFEQESVVDSDITDTGLHASNRIC
jgi:hypothetical protein